MQRRAGTNGVYRKTYQQEVEEQTKYTDPTRKADALSVLLPSKPYQGFPTIW